MTGPQQRCRSLRRWPERAAVSPCFHRIHTPASPTARRRQSPSCTTVMPGSQGRSSVPVRSWRSGRSMVLVRKLRERLKTTARSVPVARHAWARYRRHRYEGRVRRFLAEGTGRADRLPMGAVYEATMRCNLHCEFCYVGDLLNLEGEWRQELSIEALSKAFPEQKDFQISLTGGEIFMRKDIMSVLDLFREKGYAAGYLTTNGTIITEERAEALADLAARGFLKHISVSVDGPKDLHDAARGLKGTFERTTEGLRRLQDAARRKGAPLRVSINTTVAHESLDALDQMVDVAEALGVDAIGLNHLMFSTPDEVAETVKIIGAKDASVIATFVTPDPGLDVAQVRKKVARLAQKCKERNILFDFRPKVHSQLMDSYYTPGTKLEGRCLYPFLHARVSFSGKVFFCPFIRVEVGDLTESSLEQVWNGERYVEMRRTLLEHGIFPVCRRCCKGGLSPVPERRAVENLIGRLDAEPFEPTLILFPSTTPTLDADVAELAKLKRHFGAPMFCFGPHASTTPHASMLRAPDVDGMFVGEPEDAALQLARLESLDGLSAIPGLTWRRDGAIVPHVATCSYACLDGEGFSPRGTMSLQS